MTTPDPATGTLAAALRAAKSELSAKKRAILEAALELFAERGFHGVSVPELASRAAVGAGTIYRYFTNKEALVNELYQLHKTAIGNGLLAEFPYASPPREQFHAFWTRAIAFALENPHVVRFLELHHHTGYLDAKSCTIAANMERVARGFFEHASELGVAKKVPPTALMAIVWGAFAGLMKAHWAGEITLDDDLIATTEQCLWEAIRL